MPEEMHNIGAKNNIELVQKGKILKCDTRERIIRFRVSSQEYAALLDVKKYFKVETVSQAMRMTIMRWAELKKAEIIEQHELKERAAKLGGRVDFG